MEHLIRFRKKGQGVLVLGKHFIFHGYLEPLKIVLRILGPFQWKRHHGKKGKVAQIFPALVGRFVVSKGQGLGSDETVCSSCSCSICWRSSKVIDFWLTRISPNGRDLSKSQPLKAFNTISRFKKPSSKPWSANIMFRRISWIEEVAFNMIAYPRSWREIVTFHRKGYLGKNRREVQVIEGRFS